MSVIQILTSEEYFPEAAYDVRVYILCELFRVEDTLPFSCVAVPQTSKVGEALAVVVV